MNREECEAVRLSAMALRDDETPSLSRDRIEEHIRACPACRQALEAQDAAFQLLAGQSRRPLTETVWPAVARHLAKSSADAPTKPAWRSLLLLGSLLLAYKVLGMLPGVTLPWAAKLIPLVLAAATFWWLRENPFRIHSRLVAEGDTR